MALSNDAAAQAKGQGRNRADALSLFSSKSYTVAAIVRSIDLAFTGGDTMKTVQAMLAEAEAAVPRISPDEAKGLLGRADVLFLDVREPAEVATSGKVPGALAVPRGLVEFRADPASAMHDAAFDRAKTVIAYCASGGRSALVGKTLKEMGYSNVRNLGGFKGWLEAGGEVEKA